MTVGMLVDPVGWLGGVDGWMDRWCLSEPQLACDAKNKQKVD